MARASPSVAAAMASFASMSFAPLRCTFLYLEGERSGIRLEHASRQPMQMRTDLSYGPARIAAANGAVT
jgi:hypothetical protein